MYVYDIGLNFDEIISQKPPEKFHIFENDELIVIINAITEREKILKVLFDKDLELKFLIDILFNNPSEKVDIYLVKDLHTYLGIHNLNLLVLKYEKVFLVKLYLSNPFDLKFHVLCYGKRPSIDIDKSTYIVNNIEKYRKFLYLTLSYAVEVFKKLNNLQYNKIEMRKRFAFQEYLSEKYMSKK